MEATHTPPGWRQRLHQFFYAEEVPYGLALVRICLPLALLIPALPRWLHARELYSRDGAPTPLWENYGYTEFLPIPGSATAVALATLYVLSLCSLSFGWKTKTSAFIATVLGAYLGLLDTVSTLTKYTCVATHVLLLLALSECGSLWSLDAWIAGRRRPWPGGLDAGRRKAAVWPRRLLQIFLGVIYFAAAITKIQTPGFSSGDQMYFWLLADVSYANPIGEYATMWPPMLVAMGLATIIWEIVFPFVCWRGLPKAAVLVFGVGFHVMTYFMLGLLAFPLICLSLYWAFFDVADIRDFAAWLRRRRRRWTGVTTALRRAAERLPTRPRWLTPALSTSGFVLLCAVVIGGALEVERRMDVYGHRRPTGRFALTPMDPQLAERMVAGTERIRYVDQMHAFDVGTRVVGGFLADRRTSFQYGERAMIECVVAPPHGDLFIECNLHDTSDHMLQRSGQVMVRDKIRTHFDYEWTESYPAGEYDLVLKLDGNEVSRKRIHVSPAAAVANRSTATAMAR